MYSPRKRDGFSGRGISAARKQGKRTLGGKVAGNAREKLLVGGQSDFASGDGGDPSFASIFDGFAQLGGGLGEARGVVGHSQEVLEDEDLGVAGVAGADAYDGNGCGFEHGGGERFGDSFDEQHGAASLLERDRIAEDLVGVVGRFSGGDVATGDGGALGAAAYVAADGDACADHLGDQRSEGGVGFEFDDVGVTFDKEAACVADGFGVGGVIAHEGHVGHDDAVGRAALDGGGEGDCDVEGHVDGARETENDFGGGVSDEQEMDARAHEESRGGGVVAGEAGEGLGALGLGAEGFERGHGGG